MPPSDVSCKQVCDEYKKSLQGGVEVGFTCDATLCTATKADPDLVEEACSGLGDSNVSEILGLETEGRVQLRRQSDLRLYTEEEDE